MPRRQNRDQSSFLHQIVQTAELTALLSKGNSKQIALKEIKRAKQFYKGLDKTSRPLGENNPQHLDVWESLLN